VIFSIHLKKRNRDKANFDLPRLTAASDGFKRRRNRASGDFRLYAAFADKLECTTEHISCSHPSHPAAFRSSCANTSSVCEAGPRTAA